MDKSWHLNRRTFLSGIGVSLALPYLECMAEDAKKNPDKPKRCCYLYTANGVALPPKDHKDADWHWSPHVPYGVPVKKYEFTKTLECFEPLRDKISVLRGMDHHFARTTSAHTCADTFLTAGDIRGSRYRNTISVDHVAARAFRGKTRFSHMALSCDGGVGLKGRTSTLSFDARGNPIPTQNNPRLIFERMFQRKEGQQQRRDLARQGKLIDRILEDANDLNRALGKNDQNKLAEYLATMAEMEERVTRSEKWMDVVVADIDPGKLNFDVDPEKEPRKYYQVMCDLIAIAFETDITRVVTFMLNREDSYGKADGFFNIALKNENRWNVALKGHHDISHGAGKEGGYERWGRYDRWVAENVCYLVNRLNESKDKDGPILDSSIVMYGSACSKTHYPQSLPILQAGGKDLGINNGFVHNREVRIPLANLYLSHLTALGIKVDKFADSTGLYRDILT